MAKSKYLLSNQKKKRKIILFIVCLLVYTLLMGYIILNFVGFCNLNGEKYSVLSSIPLSYFSPQQDLHCLLIFRKP